MTSEPKTLGAIAACLATLLVVPGEPSESSPLSAATPAHAAGMLSAQQAAPEAAGATPLAAFTHADRQDELERGTVASAAHGASPAKGEAGRDDDPEGEIEDLAPEDAAAVIQQYCQVCHNDQLETGNLSLEGFDPTNPLERWETAEKMVVKLRAEMMPPPGMPRPEGDTLTALVETLERQIDEEAAARPNPGGRTFQRLNQPEYERAIRDLLGLEVEAEEWLPSDQMSANFDNIADVQALSPTLMDAYLNAASEIARRALGHPNAAPTAKNYANSRYTSQHEWERVEGAPIGTRGGISVLHSFPADGWYTFEMEFLSGWGERLHDIDISVDGERVALLRYGGDIDFQGRRDFPIATDSVFVRAGQRRVTAAFVRQTDGPYEDLIRPHDWSLTGVETSYGTTSPPHITDLTISGPYEPTGVSETETRRRIFTCRPTSPEEERPCAEQIIRRLASRAYRRPVTDDDVEDLMRFYEQGVEERGFEAGIRTALEAILASPHFVFRLEREPSDVGPDGIYALDDLDLASRLSFFLWGSPPDDELIEVAERGELSDPEVLEQQARRMLDDPRSEALATRFAAQWLRLQDLDKVKPDAFWFPNYDERLAETMRRETELFFDHLVRENRSLLELYEADYTFANERLADHYGIPGVSGDEFRRVEYPEDSRRKGLFGHGSVLVQTSLGNRTSPVLRGKWVMEVLLNTPPPPPPPGVPDLEETEDSKDGERLTTRERLQMHRADPVCESCHQYMDPIGLALDNFDVTGKWRIRENGMPLDTRGELYDGTPVETPDQLADALLERPIPLVRTFTLNLMAYALGRRVEHFDQPTIRRIAREAKEDDYRIRSFILGVVSSDAFRMKRADSFAADDEQQQR